jgi:hypothetical protein
MNASAAFVDHGSGSMLFLPADALDRSDESAGLRPGPVKRVNAAAILMSVPGHSPIAENIWRMDDGNRPLTHHH